MEAEESDIPERFVHELLTNKSIVYGFEHRTVADNDLYALFQAAGLSALSDHQERWHYIVESREHSGEGYDKLISCLDDINQIWTSTAPVLVLGIITFDPFIKNSEMSVCLDLGRATAYLSFNAFARGLTVHQMFDIDQEQAKKCYALPDNTEAVVGLAIGYPIPANDFPPGLEEPPNEGRPIESFVFSGQWGNNTF